MDDNIYRHKLIVRYFETDQMKVVYYSHYLVWFEAARRDFLKSKGFPYTKFEKMGFFLPVSEVHCKYFAPAHYEDEIIVELWIEELKKVSLKINYKVIREKNEELLASGYTIHPCINEHRKIVPFPEEFINIF